MCYNTHMDISCFDNKILIINDNTKSSLLRLINKSEKLLNIKIITLSELKKKYFFDYDNETIYYVCKKYNVIPSIAKIYLDNLYYIDDIDNDKVRFLNDIKKDLEENNLLIKNKLFKNYLNNSDVVLFNLKNIDKFYNRIFDNIKNVTSYNSEEKDNKKRLVICNNRNEEIEFVSSEICSLIKSGVDINNIYLSNVTSEYNYIIKSIFKMYNIPVNLKSEEHIIGTKIVKVFKSNYESGIEYSLEETKKYIKTSNDNDIYKEIINVINSYSFISDEKEKRDFIFNDIDSIKIKTNTLKNAVNVVDINNELIDDNSYVFLINYTEGVIPVNHKDEDYLSDKIKSLLNISMSYELNKNSLNNLISAIKRVNNLVVTYPKYDGNSPLYMSSSFNEELFEMDNYKVNFEHSNLYNMLKLVSLKDENKKYGTISEELLLLNNHYSDMNYLSYDNKFSKINKDDLYEFLGKHLTLSYSSINEYYSCAFKYYLDYVLKINKIEDSFEITIGNIFHKVLSLMFSDNFDFDSSYNEAINSSKYEFNNTDKFFLDKLKSDLQLIIETIKNQLNYTQLDKSMYEKEIKIVINKDLNIIFKGFVDKIMYGEFDECTVVAIIDYKTGNPTLNLNNSIYGMDMQLPVYMYLIKNSNIVNNVRIGGLYLQKILGKEKDIDKKIDSLKLQGYSNSDESILEKVDSSYRDSNVIKGMKVKNDGTFYSYSKVLSDDEIDTICDIVKNKIEEASKKIINGEFDINPKVINKVNKGCMYCKYKDICYMKNEDIVNLEEKKLFGGEENE